MAEPIAIKEEDQELQDRIKAVAKRDKHWGLLKIYRKLRKQGETVNHKRVRRLYRMAGLTLPRKEATARIGSPTIAEGNGLQWLLVFRFHL